MPVVFTSSGYLIALGWDQYDSTRQYHTYHHADHGANNHLGALHLSRTQVVAGEEVLVAVRTADTLALYSDPLLPATERFVHRVAIENVSTERLRDVNVTLELPASIVLDPSNQPHPYKFIPGDLAPGQVRTAEFRLRIDKAAVRDSVVSVRSFVHFTGAPPDSGCPQHTAGAVTSLYLVRSTPELQCDLAAPDSMSLNPLSGRIDPDEIVLTASLRSVAIRPLPAHTVKVTVSGSAFRPVPAGDSVRVVGGFATGVTQVQMWTLRLVPSAFARRVPLRVELLDSLGNVRGACQREIEVPGTPVLSCEGDPGGRTADTLVFETGSAAYTPDSLALAFQIGNPLDTVRSVRTARIDLSAAPHLALTPADSAGRAALMLPRLGSLVQTWMLRGVGVPDSTCTEPVELQYVVDPGGYYGTCRTVVRIERREPPLSCSLAVPDSLHLDGTSSGYAELPLPLRVQVSNGGGRAHDHLVPARHSVRYLSVHVAHRHRHSKPSVHCDAMNRPCIVTR